jgi:hypothetical protein
VLVGVPDGVRPWVPASVHVQASHEVIRQVMVHCYDRGALLAEVWAGYTAVLAAILREERAARDGARAEATEVRPKHSTVLHCRLSPSSTCNPCI